MQTSITGIFQGDVLVRTALVEGIRRLRVDPSQLDYVFAWLRDDDLTKRRYGDKEVAQAKKWFLATDFPVKLGLLTDGVTMPVITVSVSESVEAKNTLADLHAPTSEDNGETWPVLAGPFTPASFDPATGVLKVPAWIKKEILLAEGQLLVDRSGRAEVVEVVVDSRTVKVKPNTLLDIHGLVVKGAKPAAETPLENAMFSESYQLGCHVKGEPVHAIYLHSIVLYILLRYRQSLLEARGMQDSSLRSSDLQNNNVFGSQERVFSRYITLSGEVFHYWPKDVEQKITSTRFNIGSMLSDEDADSLGVPG